MSEPVRAYVGLGGNLGDVRQTFVCAAEAIRHVAGVLALRSSVPWESAPVGPIRDQPTFLNACLEVQVAGQVTPQAFLRALLDIERGLGRDRAREKPQGPRVLDLDLLLWGTLELCDAGPPPLALPHPRLHQRAFALLPLCELVGEHHIIPGRGVLGELLAGVRNQGVRRQ
jgi:2-amino-4-hydroxy-6-hydroxymethyldihydropteridine diphosphokinase